ncbi:MAG: hypothetical protein KGM95_09365 [Betaproteobacteria bacterium]|nr:hypothetical protein [Betaproteobacteria bacterium]
MDESTIIQWLIAVAILFVVPFWRIFKRAGFKPAVAVVALVPGGIVVLLWVIALAKWPAFTQEKKE